MSYTLPEPAMKETNPYIDCGTDPYNGAEVLDWFSDAQMHAAFDAGRASRDAEVEALKAKVDKLDLELRVAERARDRRDESIEILTQTVDQLRLEAEGLERFRADAERLDWLNNNFYIRENLDWITGKVCNKNNMWVFFAPTGPQGNIRTVLDAAMSAQEE